MSDSRKALLAMHEEMWAKTFGRILTGNGYELVTSDSVAEMKDQMDVSIDGVPQNFFDLYMMDANLGSPGSRSYEPAEQIFSLIKPDYDAGKIKYLAITGNSDDAIDLNQSGVPCLSKGKITEISDFIRG